MTCLWCGDPMPDRSNRGSPRRFCRPEHRRAYHTAARRYVDREVSEGRLPVPALMGSRKARTLSPGQMLDMAARSAAVGVSWSLPGGFSGDADLPAEFCDQYARAGEAL